MTPKRKNKLDKAKNNHIYGYLPVFSPDFKADLAWWYRNEPKKGDKILDLVADILDGEQGNRILVEWNQKRNLA